MQNSRIGTSEAMINATPKKLKKENKLRRYLGIFSFFLGILLVATTLFAIQFAVLPGFKVLGYLENIKDNASLLLQDLSVKSIANLDTYLGNIQTELSRIDDEISRYEFLKSIDETKGYYENFQTSRRILEKGNTLIEYSLPKLKNILTATGFSTDKNESSVLGSLETESVDEESSISLIMKELPLYLDLYNEIEPQIISIFDEVAKIDANYVPSLPNLNLSDNLASINKFGEEFPTLSQRTVNLIKYLPDLLGSKQDAKYLVVLQNEAEMRASGGILTAYGDVTLQNGEIADEIKLEDTWNLQLYLWELGLAMPHNNIYGQSYLMNSGCGATEARAQDVAMYPDIYESLMLFKDYYDRANFYNPRNFPEYENIVIVNFNFAKNILSLVQPLDVEGFGEVTADNLFSFIKAETDSTKFAPLADDRKDIIGKVSDAVKERLFNLPYSELPRVIDMIVKSFQARDIGLASIDDEMQAFFDEYGMSGRYAKEFNGDYFSLSEAQNCSLKLNQWVRNTVNHDVTINSDGSISRAVQVKWQQPKIYDDSLYGQYDSSSRFTYRAWVRFVMPKDSFNIDSDGYERSGYLYYYPQVYFDKVFNKQISDNVVQFDHRRFDESDTIEKEEMNVSYNLPGSINYLSQGGYALLLQKHPGKSWGETHTVNISDTEGNTYSMDVVLDRDKVVRFKNGVLSVDNYDTSLDWLMDDIVNRLPFDRLQ